MASLQELQASIARLHETLGGEESPENSASNEGSAVGSQEPSSAHQDDAHLQ